MGVIDFVAVRRGLDVLGRERLCVALVLIVAAVLRFQGLNSNPPGLTCDEAAYGVNAHSIALTGKTIHGDAFPLYCHERTFSMWGNPSIIYQPIQLYSLVPLTAVFGRSPAVVRTPSVLFSLLGILAGYLLARSLFDGTTGVLTAILLACSPWHHHYSRIGFEAMSLSALLALGAFFLWRGLEHRRSLILGAALMGLATYAYPPGRLFAPLMLFAFGMIHRGTLWARRRDLFAASFAFAATVLPNVIVILTHSNQSRSFDLLIFNADVAGEPAIGFLREHSAKGWASTILSNAILRSCFLFIAHWLSYVSPEYLFLKGSSYLQFGARDQGMCHLATLPLLLVGAASFVRRWREERVRFLLAWLLLFPVPASLTTGPTHATRSITNFPVLEIISAVGLTSLLAASLPALRRGASFAWKPVVCAATSGMLMLALFVETVRTQIHYARRYPIYAAPYWDSAGFPAALARIRQVSPPEEQVFVSPSILNAYLFVLFFDRADYRNLDPSVPFFQGLLPSKYQVGWPGRFQRASTTALWLIRASDLPDHRDAARVAEIPFPDGSPNLLLVRYAGE